MAFRTILFQNGHDLMSEVNLCTQTITGEQKSGEDRCREESSCNCNKPLILIINNLTHYGQNIFLRFGLSFLYAIEQDGRYENS